MELLNHHHPSPPLIFTSQYTRTNKCFTTYLCLLSTTKSQFCMLSHFSHVRLCVTLWIVDHQASLSMGFPKQEYWSGLPCPPPGDLPDPRIKPESHVSCIGRRVLYHQRHLGSPRLKFRKYLMMTTAHSCHPIFISVYHTVLQFALCLFVSVTGL